MSPLYTSEKASGKKFWDGLVRIDDEVRLRQANNPPGSDEESLRPPLSIEQVKRGDAFEWGKYLELSHRYVFNSKGVALF
jgi:hypothetical protein